MYFKIHHVLHQYQLSIDKIIHSDYRNGQYVSTELECTYATAERLVDGLVSWSGSDGSCLVLFPFVSDQQVLCCSV